MLVDSIIIPAYASDVVQEYSSCEVAERLASRLKLEAFQSTFENTVQAVALHLIFQVLSVPVEVLVSQHVVMHHNKQLAKSFTWDSLVFLFCARAPCFELTLELIIVYIVVLFHILYIPTCAALYCSTIQHAILETVYASVSESSSPSMYC